MVPPTVKALANLDSSKSQIDAAFGTIRDCITEIYFNEELFSVQDHTTKEVDDFIKNRAKELFKFKTGIPLAKKKSNKNIKTA